MRYVDSVEGVWLAVAGVCALLAMFVLAVLGVIDMDDTQQRQPIPAVTVAP